MSTLGTVQDASGGATTRPIAWLTCFGAFVFGLVAFVAIREARFTTDVVVPAAVAMLAGVAHDRFLARRNSGRLIGVALTIVAFVGGAVTGLLLPA